MSGRRERAVCKLVGVAAAIKLAKPRERRAGPADLRRAARARPRPVCIDFEGHRIDEGRPRYPPEPTGVAIKYPGKAARYYAWGHPTKNNCTRREGERALREAWEYARKHGALFANAKFDTDVAETRCGMRPLSWDKVHDVIFLVFLDDPNAMDFGLKPSAKRLLGWEPGERDAVKEWLLTNQPIEGVKISASPQSDHCWFHYIWAAPGDLVGEYSRGDADRTEALFNLLWARVITAGMGAAYDRERRLMPHLLESERQGLPVHAGRLRRDISRYRKVLATVEAWIVRRLKLRPGDINLDSGEQLVQAMVDAGRADPELIPRTPKTGKFQHNKEALLVGVTDEQLLGVLKYRTQLLTCLRTFMEPWLRTAEESLRRGLGPLIYTHWNQTKRGDSDGSFGARTGRLSSTPNFQNIPKEFVAIFAHEERDPERRKALPRCPIAGLPTLPRVRSYVAPFPGEVLLDRDYSQQEPRILAHFDGGQLMVRYQSDPWVDFHDFAKAELEKRGLHYPRRIVKNTNLGLIYGMGVSALAARCGLPWKEAQMLKRAVLALYPGLQELYADAKLRAKADEPFRTWGGRLYFCEKAAIINGRLVTFDYKLPNALIQGSAADCTKEAIIRFCDTRPTKAWRLLLNVHDQVTISAPLRDAHRAMEHLRICMESVEFDVPMLSEGAWSTRSWEELENYDKKGRKVFRRPAWDKGRVRRTA